MMDFNGFYERPLMGILRGIRDKELAPVLETILAAGLRAIEITMNTKGAAALIKRLADLAAGRILVGAGTVLTSDDLERALDAGARFIVMPTLVEAVVSRCVARAVPVFPGALTPQEIWTAWTAGATMVKVFPSSVFGPAYFREIAGPFPDIPLLACGGVGAHNLNEYFRCGARAASFGGSVFKREWMAQGAFDRIGEAVGALVREFETGCRS